MFDGPPQAHSLHCDYKYSGNSLHHNQDHTVHREPSQQTLHYNRKAYLRPRPMFYLHQLNDIACSPQSLSSRLKSHKRPLMKRPKKQEPAHDWLLRTPLD